MNKPAARRAQSRSFTLVHACAVWLSNAFSGFQSQLAQLAACGAKEVQLTYASERCPACRFKCSELEAPGSCIRKIILQHVGGSLGQRGKRRAVNPDQTPESRRNELLFLISYRRCAPLSCSRTNHSVSRFRSLVSHPTLPACAPALNNHNASSWFFR